MKCRRFLPSILILLLCLPGTAWPCIGCRQPTGFSIRHPHAISIALKIRAARTAGLLPEVDASTTADVFPDVVRFAEFTPWKKVVRQTDGSAMDADRMELFVIGTGSVFRIEMQPGGVSVKNLGIQKACRRSAGPNVFRLVTSRRVVAALGQQQLTIEQAIKHGILEVECPSPATSALPRSDSRRP